MTTQDVNATIDTVWRMESPKIIAGLTRIVGDIAVAEDLAQDALVAALEQWPEKGIPDNPAAWLTGTAKHRAVDHLRRRGRIEKKHETLGRELDERGAAAVAELHTAIDDQVGAGVLRLISMTCPPPLPAEARAALTLRLVGGLTTEEIGRAFLTPEPTIAQRIVRAKKTLVASKVPFEVPRSRELPERLASVLEVIYLIFNEGYSATSGKNWLRHDLCDEALRLGRILAELIPEQAEVHGLVALMEIQASRSRTRVDAEGRPILLLDQDRSRWDQMLIRRGLTAIERAEAAGDQGPYTAQARIAACHARARTAAETDWNRIVELYGELAEIQPSPIVELNRAVAVSMASGPAAALTIVDRLRRMPELKEYHLLPSVRGDLLAKLGRHAEAKKEFERAAKLTRNEREKELLMERASQAVAECAE